MEFIEHHEFRVTRNEDVEIEEDDVENLIQALEKGLLRRRFGPPMRLEVADDMETDVLDLLMRELDISEQEVYRLPARSTSPDCAIVDLDRPGAEVRSTSAPVTHPLPTERRPTHPTSSPRCGAGHPAAPPVRLVCDQRAGVRRAGGGRSRTCSPSSRRSTAPAATGRSSRR